MNVPDKSRGHKRFQTTCSIVEDILHNNVMIISCCSSYMYTMRLNTTSRCSWNCKIPEGLFNVWSLSSGSGGSRFPPSLESLNELAIDQCQIDDFMIGIATKALENPSRNVQIWSVDGRFTNKTIVLPKIVYPFYIIVQTQDSRVGIPIYQKDSATLYEMVHHTKNPDFGEPYTRHDVPIYMSYWDTKRKLRERYDSWRRSRAASRFPRNISEHKYKRNGLENSISGLSETSYHDPVKTEEYSQLQQKGFDSVEGGDDPDCNYVTGAPQIGITSLDRTRHLASFSDILHV